VFLDHLAIPDTALAAMLACGRRALAPQGRLWLFERYESLAGPLLEGAAARQVRSRNNGGREKVVEHPLGRLRRLLADVGLTCERLSPIEADGEHVLAAVAVPAVVTPRDTGRVSAA